MGTAADSIKGAIKLFAVYIPLFLAELTTICYSLVLFGECEAAKFCKLTLLFESSESPTEEI